MSSLWNMSKARKKNQQNYKFRPMKTSGFCFKKQIYFNHQLLHNNNPKCFQLDIKHFYFFVTIFVHQEFESLSWLAHLCSTWDQLELWGQEELLQDVFVPYMIGISMLLGFSYSPPGVSSSKAFSLINSLGFPSKVASSESHSWYIYWLPSMVAIFSKYKYRTPT